MLPCTKIKSCGNHLRIAKTPDTKNAKPMITFTKVDTAFFPSTILNTSF